MNTLSIKEEQSCNSNTSIALFKILDKGVSDTKKLQIRKKYYYYQISFYLTALLMIIGGVTESAGTVRVAFVCTLILFAYFPIDTLRSYGKITEKAGNSRKIAADSLTVDNIFFLFYDKDKFPRIVTLGIILLLFSILYATGFFTFIILFLIMILSIWVNHNYLVDTITLLNTYFAEN